MIHGLARDYWPVGIRRPLLRTALSFAVSPLVIVLVLMVLLIAAEMAFAADADIARPRALAFAPVILAGTYVILFTAGVPVFLALWTLRLRGWSAWLLAGMLVGLICALAAPVFGTAKVGPAPVVVFTVHFGLLMLVVRAIAGIRRIDD